MPRYLIERSFPAGFRVPAGSTGTEAWNVLLDLNQAVGVTWVHSYIRDDRGAMFCVYDAPTPEALRRASERNGLPIDRISRVWLLDPYAYPGRGGHRRRKT